MVEAEQRLERNHFSNQIIIFKRFPATFAWPISINGVVKDAREKVFICLCQFLLHHLFFV